MFFVELVVSINLSRGGGFAGAGISSGIRMTREGAKQVHWLFSSTPGEDSKNADYRSNLFHSNGYSQGDLGT